MLTSSLATSRRITTLCIATFLLALGFVGFTSSPASAHNTLVTSVPENGAVLPQAPAMWSLSFTSDVPLDTASGEIIAASGVRTPLPAPLHGVNSKEIRFTLPTNLAGSYTARWRLVGIDGHVLTERVRFTITTASVTMPSTTTIPDVVSTAPIATTTTPTAILPSTAVDDAPTPEPVRLFLRFFGYIALLLVGGTLVIEKFVALGVTRHSSGLRSVKYGSVALVIVPLLQLIIFLDDSQDFGVIGSLLHLWNAFDTTSGSMLLVRCLAGVTLVGCVNNALKKSPLSTSRTSHLITPPLVVSGAVYLIALAYTGHSRSMKWPLIGIPADIVHTAAAIAWLGGLVVFVTCAIPAMEAGSSFQAFRRFGSIAHYSVIAIVGTGVIQTLRLHGNIFTLFTQSHGRWLLLKLVLVALILKIGDINRRRLLRQLPIDETALTHRVSLLRRASITEAINGGLVMLITSVLVTSSFN